MVVVPTLMKFVGETGRNLNDGEIVGTLKAKK